MSSSSYSPPAPPPPPLPPPRHQHQQQQHHHYHHTIHSYAQPILLPPIKSTHHHPRQFPSPYPTNHPYHHHHHLHYSNNLPTTPKPCRRHHHFNHPYPLDSNCPDLYGLHPLQPPRFQIPCFHKDDPSTIPPLHAPHHCPNRYNNNDDTLSYSYLPNPVPLYYSQDLPHVSLPYNLPPQPFVPNTGHLPYNVPYNGSHPNSLNELLPNNSAIPYMTQPTTSPQHQHVLYHHDSGLDQDSLIDPRWSSYSTTPATYHHDNGPLQPPVHQLTTATFRLPKSPYSPDVSNDSIKKNLDCISVHHVHRPAAPLSFKPTGSKYVNEDMSFLVMAEDGVDIGKKRDYMVFTRDMYAQMIDSLQHPNDPLPAHITDRRRWRRLMKLLTLHQDKPKHQCITWHHSPLWIVAVEDWNELIWAFHKVTVSKMDLPSDLVPGHLGCYSVAKTARLLSREYQTRRSRCGIFIEYIHQVLLTCPMCGTNAKSSPPPPPAAAVDPSVLLPIKNNSTSSPPAAGPSVQNLLEIENGTIGISCPLPVPSVQKLLAIENRTI